VRALTANQEAVLAGNSTTWDVRVYAKNAAGALVELNSAGVGGTLPGFNSLQMVEWGESLDDIGMTATVTLLREQHGLSVAPLMTAAPANVGWAPGGSYAPLLAVGRELWIQAEPRGSAPGQFDSTTLFFRGYIDSIDVASGNFVRLECRDQAALVCDTFLEEEFVFSFCKDGSTLAAARIWTPSTAVVLDEYFIPTEATRKTPSSTRRFYKVTTAGTTGTTEPTWPSSGTVGSGTAVFTSIADTVDTGYAMQDVIQTMLDRMTALGGTAPTLYTPVSPAFNLLPWKQSRTGLLTAIREAVGQRGWDIRYKWRAGTSQFELTLFEPDRAKTTPDRTFTASQYSEISGASTSIDGIRNVVRIVYSASGTVDNTGNPQRLLVTRKDDPSIASYRRRTIEIAESSTSRIDTQAEAEAMADAILADLKDPKVTASVQLLDGFPWVELGDLYRFPGNGAHWDTNQDLAVYAYRHRATNGRLSTELQLRGKPSARFDGWHRLDTRAKEGSHSLRLFQSGGGLTLSAAEVVGGIQLSVTRELEKTVPQDEMFEYHVSRTPSFTPDATSLKALTQSRAITLPDLVPGATYYAKTRPRTLNAGKPVVAEPSAQVSFTAGQGNAAHLSADFEAGRLPLNGGFETNSDPTGPPDHWAVTTGVWNTDFTLGADGSNNYLRGIASGAGIVSKSDIFPMDGSDAIHVTAMIRRVSGGSGGGRGDVYFESFDKDIASLGSQTIASVDSTDTASAWSKKGLPLVASSSARFGRIGISNGGTTSDPITWDVDNVRVQRQTFQPNWASEVTSGGKTIASTTFADLKSVTFAQHLGRQSIVMICAGSAFADTAADKMSIRFVYDGVTIGADYPVFFNEANEHQQFAFAVVLEGAATPGSKTAKVQWSRTGTGTITMNGDDSVTLVVF